MRVNVYILLIVKLYKTNVLISLYQHVLSILNNLKKKMLSFIIAELTLFNMFCISFSSLIMMKWLLSNIIFDIAYNISILIYKRIRCIIKVYKCNCILHNKLHSQLQLYFYYIPSNKYKAFAYELNLTLQLQS